MKVSFNKLCRPKVDARELYREEVDSEYFSAYDYQPMINAFGKVIIQIDDDDYQGDTRVLYSDYGGGIGFLIFGWGSCSGCDALQACRNIDEVQELCNQLQNDIKWFNSKEEALAWARQKDWEAEWFWHEKEGRMFVRLVMDYLNGNDGEPPKEEH